jgi:LysR family transcriptional regulator (chromosome initiation inhibitor)
MRYRPMATPAFIDRWFGEGVNRAALAAAPVVIFDRKDDIQHNYLRAFGEPELTPPQHFVPVSADFVTAVRLGFGWAMLPDQQSAPLVASGELVPLGSGPTVDITLYWQQWALRITSLDRVAEVMAAEAARSLARPSRS